MTMTETDTHNAELDLLFKAAQQDRAQIPDSLSHRMLQDAARVQADILQPVAVQRVRVSRWRQLQDILGGWPGLGGLVATCAIGVWLGFSPPDTLPDPFLMMTQNETDIELFYNDNLDTIMMEEG